MPGTTDQYEGMIAETITIAGHNGDPIHAYYARPLGDGPFPGVVWLHHFPGWDEWSKEAARKLVYHGYAVIEPDLYCRVDHGQPEDVAAKVRANGGVPDPQVVGDSAACRDFLRSQANANGKVGVVGTCSGGRHAVLAASCSPGFNAVIDLWGGGVVAKPEDATEMRPVAPIEYTKDLDCPMLGLFGNDDRAPSAEQVDIHEAELKKHGKTYEFHRYDGAGHGFFYHHAPQAYRAEAAVDGWKKVLEFFNRQLGN
ncbi:MAG: dienelactone hydrolase family protein [Dehalococcoidia bacterium]